MTATLPRRVDAPRLALVSRGDPLTPYLHRELADRYPVVGEIDVELHGWRRAAVAASTFRPRREQWAERYMKSRPGFGLRSRLAQQQLERIGDHDAVVQTHTLFDSRSSRAFVYVDCTYRQAMAGWPAWAPQHGRARDRWLDAETACFTRARHLFAFTGETRRSLVEDYGIDDARVTVVGAGVNFDEREVAPHARTRRDLDAPTILFVGKDFGRKGVPVLLEAFAGVRRVLPPARLVIVGADVAGPLPPGVAALGRVGDRQRMTDLYHDATVFCLPSLFDPSPLVVLEAMAHGLPCVLSHAASHHVRDVVGPGAADPAGIAVPTGDATALADGLLAVLRDPDRAARYGARARQVVQQRYLWRHVVDRMAPALEATPVRPVRVAARRS